MHVGARYQGMLAEQYEMGQKGAPLGGHYVIQIKMLDLLVRVLFVGKTR
jgi:hypothetical protein